MTKKEEECKEEGKRKRKGGDMPQNAEVQNLGGGMRAHVQWPLVPDATRNLGAEAPRVHVIQRSPFVTHCCCQGLRTCAP